MTPTFTLVDIVTVHFCVVTVWIFIRYVKRLLRFDLNWIRYEYRSHNRKLKYFNLVIQIGNSD